MNLSKIFSSPSKNENGVMTMLKMKSHFDAMKTRKYRNVAKHIRIADATTGHEKAVHVERAQTLASRYGFKLSAV